MKSWCIGKPSAHHAAEMEDVLAVYARPCDAARPLVCLDEVSTELHTTPHGTLPLAPGQPERQDYEYARQGVCNLFLAVEPLTGRRTVGVSERRTMQDFAEELRILAEETYLDAERIVLVTDNLNTHTPACLYARFVSECELPVLARHVSNDASPHPQRAGARSRCLAVPLQCRQGHCRPAVHNRRRPHQAQAPLSSST